MADAIQINFNSPTSVPCIANVDAWPTNWKANWLSPRGFQASPQAAVPEHKGSGVFNFTKPNQCDFDEPDECVNDWVLRIIKTSNKCPPPPSGGVTVTALNGPSIVSSGLRVIAETMNATTGEVLSQAEIGGDGTTSPGPPKIATEPSGNNMVVWQADSDGTTTISGRVLNSQGQPLTPEILIASGTTSVPGHPSVTALSNGDFLVVWSGSDDNRYGPWIRMQKFDRWGTPLTPPKLVVNCDFVPGDFPQAAAVGTGGYAIAWEMADSGGIYVLQTDAAGNRGEARFAQGSGATPVLENLDSGDVNAVLSYGLYSDDGYLGSGNVSVVTQPSSCSPPLAVNDAFTTDNDKPLTIGIQELLSNDAPGVSLSQISTKCPLAADGSYCTYAPPAGFTGTDSFTYSVRDPENNTGSATVSINVRDTRPHAVFTVSCTNRTCTVHTTSNGTYPITRYLWNWGDGTPVIEPTTPYPWADQTHMYALSGRYTITHTVYDTVGQTGTLALEILANTKPVAVADTATTDRDVPVTIPILANDSDADGDALTPYSVTLSQPGAAYQAVPYGQSWAIRFTPPDSFVGTSNLTYMAADRWGGVSSVTPVTVTVRQWTVIVDALGEQFYTPQNTSLRIPLGTLLANDYSDNGVLSIVSYDTSILMGTLDCTTETTACTYRPPINAAGYTLFKYKACDSVGHCDTATVRIYVAFRGNPPTAADDYFSTTRNTPKTFTIQDLVANDYDADGDTLSISGFGARGFGSLACSTPIYKCTYTPNVGFVGTDRFQYTATDVMNPAVIAYINVLTLPPVTPTFDAREDVRVTGTNVQMYISYAGLTANDYAPSGGPVSVTSVDTTGMLGTLTCDSYGCTYKPWSGYQGTTQFKYTASDGHGATDTAIVKVRVGGTNISPVAIADSFSTPKNTGLRFSSFELLRNDYDADNEPLAALVYSGTTAKGTLSCDAWGYWCTYTPFTNVTGADTFTYSLTDGAAYAGSTFTINIQP